VGRRIKRVGYQLDCKDIKELSMEDIRVILRGADDFIMSGGRALLAKTLKGSKEKKC